MGIADDEEVLFKTLRYQNSDIVIDGVVDEASFLSARYRIVYILKEVNGGKGWDLREYVCDGARPQTWDNIARWTEGILSWEQDFAWKIMCANNEERRKNELKKITVVNLKKLPGGHTSDSRKIYEAALTNSEVVMKQLALYHADFIILCGTESAFIASCYGNTEVEWKSTRHGVRYFADCSTVIISFSHPAARVSDNLLYYALIDAIREIQGG